MRAELRSQLCNCASHFQNGIKQAAAHTSGKFLSTTMFTPSLTSALALLSLFGGTLAHPGHDHAAEALERATSLASMGRRSLSHCSAHLAQRGVHSASVARRRALANSLARSERVKRDFATVTNTSHKSNLTGVTPATDAATLFGGQAQCILGPETTEGPYCTSARESSN